MSEFIEYYPSKMKGDFDCSHMNLTSLIGAPMELTGLPAPSKVILIVLKINSRLSKAHRQKLAEIFYV